jgi:hypothetical protein
MKKQFIMLVTTIIPHLTINPRSPNSGTLKDPEADGEAEDAAAEAEAAAEKKDVIGVVDEDIVKQNVRKAVRNVPRVVTSVMQQTNVDATDRVTQHHLTEAGPHKHQEGEVEIIIIIRIISNTIRRINKTETIRLSR